MIKFLIKCLPEGTDLYTGMVLGGLAELPALVLCYVFFMRLGRRLGLALFMFFSGLSCFLIQFVAGTSLEYLGRSFSILFIVGVSRLELYVVSPLIVGSI